MFSVEKIVKLGWETLVLRNTKTGCFVEIIPQAGAMLNAFYVPIQGKMLNIIEGYDNREDYEQHCESKGFRSAKLSPFVCRMKDGAYRFEKTDYKVDGFYLGKNALHGLIYKSPFKIKKLKWNKKSASAEMEYKYRNSGEGFPFSYNCIVKYELKKSCSLSISTSIVNKGQTKMPVTDGWHPYFTLRKKINKLEMRMNVKKIVEFDSELIPTGKLKKYEDFCSFTALENSSFDNCFLLKSGKSAAVQLRDRFIGIRLDIIPSAGYPYLQVYTPPGRDSIAFENLSAAPDAFNNKMGLIVLKKSAQKTFKTKFSVKKIKP